MADKYGKGVTQIVLRWIYQRGIVSLAKGSSVEHMKQNLDIFDFELSADDIKIIAQLDTEKSVYTESTIITCLVNKLECTKKL